MIPQDDVTVVVKTISDKGTIELRDSITSIPTTTSVLLIGIPGCVGSIAGVASMWLMTIGAQESSVLPVTLISGLGMLSSMFAFMFDLGYRNTPTYRVYYASKTPHRIDGVTVIKTTPEADQKAICSAVKTIEEKVQEIATRKQELSVIAARCK